MRGVKCTGLFVLIRTRSLSVNIRLVAEFEQLIEFQEPLSGGSHELNDGKILPYLQNIEVGVLFI